MVLLKFTSLLCLDCTKMTGWFMSNVGFLFSFVSILSGSKGAGRSVGSYRATLWKRCRWRPWAGSHQGGTSDACLWRIELFPLSGGVCKWGFATRSTHLAIILTFNSQWHTMQVSALESVESGLLCQIHIEVLLQDKRWYMVVWPSTSRCKMTQPRKLGLYD